MTQDVRVYSMMVEHDQAVPMFKQIDQIIAEQNSIMI